MIPPLATHKTEEDDVGLLISLIVGGVIGWLASLIMKTNAQMGVIANIVVGIVGSALGGWVAGALGFAAYGMAARLVVMVGGAVLLIAILRGLGLYK
jgi:uncharacterized membrane protein YeaQ/YmgE (transglycosylase-associated protein family)